MGPLSGDSLAASLVRRSTMWVARWALLSARRSVRPLVQVWNHLAPEHLQKRPMVTLS